MVKRVKKHDDHEERIKKRNFIMSMFILVIMVLSVVGFAMMSGGGNSSSVDSAGDLPIGQYFQNPQTGEVYYGAVKGGERFVFFNGIDGYDDDVQMATLADKIKAQSNVVLKVDSSFVSDDSVYVISKALDALKISYVRDDFADCNVGTLVLTNDVNMSGDCMIFAADAGDEYTRADVLVYHLVK